MDGTPDRGNARSLPAFNPEPAACRHPNCVWLNWLKITPLGVGRIRPGALVSACRMGERMGPPKPGAASRLCSKTKELLQARGNVKVDISTFLRPTELAMKTMHYSTVGCILAIDLGKCK